MYKVQASKDLEYTPTKVTRSERAKLYNAMSDVLGWWDMTLDELKIRSHPSSRPVEYANRNIYKIHAHATTADGGSYYVYALLIDAPSFFGQEGFLEDGTLPLSTIRPSRKDDINHMLTAKLLNWLKDVGYYPA